MRQRNLMLGASAATMMIAAPLFAQAQQTSDSGTVLEEVIVTAERVETSLQRTAVSVAAFNTETLKQQSFRPLEGELSVNASYFHTGQWQTQQVKIPGYELANLRVDWSNIGGRGIGAAFWMTNVFNEDYLQSPAAIVATLPARTANFGDPRLYGVELSYRW